MKFLDEEILPTSFMHIYKCIQKIIPLRFLCIIQNNVSYGTCFVHVCVCVYVRCAKRISLYRCTLVSYVSAIFQAKRRLCLSAFSMRNEDYKIVRLLSVFHKV